MSKVLFLVNHDVVIYNFRLELVEKLLREGHRVIISSPYGKRIDDLKALGCEYYETSLSRHGINPYEDIKLLFTYKKLIKRLKPDIVLTYTIKPNIYGGIACSMLGVPYVMNITGLGTAVEKPGLLQMITVTLYRIAVKKVQTIFFQNKENEEFFALKGLAVNKHKMLPGSGVNLQKFVPMEYPSDGKIEFAFISRIMKEKGIDQYLEAAEYIVEKYNNTVFHVCGFCEQDYEEKLQELQTKGVIVYHGMIHDINVFLKDIHCTIHPTYYPEGLSNILLESCASARPIITTNRAGCREVVDDGINGYIIKEKDSADLIDKIEKFLNLSHEEKKQMGLRGREKTEKEFDRNIVIDKYMNEVNKL